MIRKILVVGNPLLRKKSKPVKVVDAAVRKLIADMAETMYASEGAGLAAIQIGELKRVIVVDISKKKDGLMAFINPKIIKKSGEQVGVEACLSVPKLEGEVTRSETITVKAKNLQFEDVEIEADEYLAVAIQHEIDHCDGILYIDKVDKSKLRSTHESKDI